MQSVLFSRLYLFRGGQLLNIDGTAPGFKFFFSFLTLMNDQSLTVFQKNRQKSDYYKVGSRPSGSHLLACFSQHSSIDEQVEHLKANHGDSLRLLLCLNTHQCFLKAKHFRDLGISASGLKTAGASCKFSYLRHFRF